MAVRTLNELRRDQQELLQEFGSGGTPGGAFSGGQASSEPPLRIGRVTQIVTSHATYGPHLVVQPQEFSGQPPAASDATTPPRRVYPAPRLSTVAYAVDESVAIWIARGAEFALKLG